MANPPPLNEMLTLEGLGTEPTGVCARRVILYNEYGERLPWPIGLGQENMGASLPVAIATDQSPVPSRATPSSTTGQFVLLGSAASTISGAAMPVAGYTAVACQVTITGTASCKPELSLDGINWQSVYVNFFQSGAGDAPANASTISATAIGWVSVAGFNYLRFRVASLSSGTVTVIGNGIVGPVAPTPFGVTGSGGAVTSNTIASDAVGTSSSGLYTAGFNYLFNSASSNWERWRSNLDGALLASAARTTTTVSATQTNYNARNVVLALNVTVNPGGAETLRLDLQGSPDGGTIWYTVANGTASAFGGAAGDQIVSVGPGDSAGWNDGTGSTGRATSCPRTWRARVTHSGAGSWTYSVSYALTH